MRKYVSYLDSISVDPAQHERTMKRLTQEPRQSKNPRVVYRYAALAACVAMVLLCVWAIPTLRDTRRNLGETELHYTSVGTPGQSGNFDTVIIEDPNAPTNPAYAYPANSPFSYDTDIPSKPDDLYPAEERPTHTISDDNQTQTEPSFPTSGAVYHNIDASQITFQGTPAAVPFGYFFTNRLTMFANNKTGINLNNGVRWEYSQFEISDVEEALHAYVNTPFLPDGDYTYKQQIMIDEATGRTIAYQTVYTYFTMETMMFERCFSVFYFSLDDFSKRDYRNLEESENIVHENSEVTIYKFPDPIVSNAYYGMPQVRQLIYFNTDVAIVIEAITAPAEFDDVVYEAETLEKYEQSDKELISMMQSLITSERAMAG